MPLIPLHLRRHAFVFLLASLLFAGSSVATSLLSARWQVNSLVNDRIMPGIIEASRYSLMDEATVATIAEQVNNDLRSLTLQSWLGALSSCELQLRAIENTNIGRNPASSGFLQHLQITGQQSTLTTTSATSASLSASFTLDCLIAPGPVISMSLLFATLVTALAAGMPRGYSPQQRQLMNVLSDAGLEWQDIRTILKHLQKNDTASLQWYDFLIQRIQSGSLSVEQLLQSANASDCIQFHHDRQSVSIREIEIPLSRTPYFYYALYAYQRHNDAQLNFSACDDSGWILNPASGRANPEHTRLLLSLMKTHGGHQKAIKELEAHGVRAKTMDQNRNKVKEELVKVLGESVAEQYLFETRRDSRTGRNHYRLKTSATKIILPL